MCLLRKDYELTLLLVDYERAVLHEWVLWWKELELHRWRMQEMEKNIRELREEVERLIRSTTH